MFVWLISILRGGLLEVQNYIAGFTTFIPEEVLGILQLGETASFLGFSVPVFFLYVVLFDE